MMKLKIIKILLFLFVTPILFSQMDNSDNNLSQDLIIKIELANPQIYHQDDQIYINVKIFNSSQKEITCLIADDKRYSFDFQMVTMQNRQIEHSQDYIISFHRVQPVFKNVIRLGPGEGYIFEALLNDYFNLDTPGQFFIKSVYYPELKLNNSEMDTITSNQLSLNIRPSGIQEEMIKEQMMVEEEKKLFISKRPPDEVIEFMLDARMKEEWEKYFLYIDLEKLILTNNRFRKSYLKSDVEKQRELLEDYKVYLKRNTIDEISFMPTRFEIVKTEYTKGRGKVEVIEYFKYQDYIEKKYYTYFLTKKSNIWYVYSYEVMNMGVK